MTTIFGIALAVVLVVGLVLIYNQLIVRKNQVANAYGQIDVQLKRRHDLIPNLVEVARGYMAHEAATLEAVIKARSQAQAAAGRARSELGSAPALGAVMAAEQTLGANLGKLFALSEAYPDLQANQTMRELSEELTSTENRIAFARQAYNDMVLVYNIAIAAFPAVCVAAMFRFNTVAVLESTQSEAERQVPSVQF